MVNTKKILFSGIQPTGNTHIGNYFGALKNWVDLQDKYITIYSIVDWHALTIDQDPKQYRQKVIETTIDLLAIGVDPKKSILFLQSQIKGHTDLNWIFNTLTPMSELERMTQYKDKAKQNKHNINVGLFDYPVLQAADILLYKAEIVPIGEDQVQHIELANTISKKFNNKYGQYFSPIKPLLTKGARIMSLINPDKKMSKSLGESNYIALRDDPKTIKAKIAKAVTDAGPAQAGKKSLGVHNLFELLHLFKNNETVEKYEKQYNNGTIKYSDMKEELAEAIIETLKPIQERIKKLEKKPKKIETILARGAKQAQVIADKNIKEIRNIIGLLK